LVVVRRCMAEAMVEVSSAVAMVEAPWEVR